MRSIFLLVSVIILVSLCVYSLIAVDIPRIARVKGYAGSSGSSWKALSPQNALLVNMLVTEKDVVRRGQVVAELSSERYSQNQNIESEQARLALKKINLVLQEIEKINLAAVHAENAIKSQLSNMRHELIIGERELELIALRLEDIYKQQARQHRLILEGFISQEAVELKNSDMLRLKGEQSSSERHQISLKSEIEKQINEIELIKLKAQTQVSQLSRELVNFRQEFNEHSSKKVQLVSPIDGFVAQVTVKPGQVVKSDIPMLTVIPSDGGIEAILLLPSRSIGFVREGQRVSVRYQAYPHEHYGRHFGIVSEISRVALPPQEVAHHIQVDEPVYTVRVKLPQNHLEYQDKKLPISSGMVLEGDIELDRLKIYQWLLEPLYRLGGRGCSY